MPGESETLLNIRTMRHIKTGTDIARNGGIMTAGKLYRPEKPFAQLEVADDRRITALLHKEKLRAQAFRASTDKARQGLLNARGRLATVINKNRALTAIRKQLQQEESIGRQGGAQSAAAPPLLGGQPRKSSNFRTTDIRY